MTLDEFIRRGKRDDFAAQVGIKTGYLNQICAGIRRPSLPVALRITAATGGQVSIESLCPLEDGEPYPLTARLRDCDPVPDPADVLRRALEAA